MSKKMNVAELLKLDPSIQQQLLIIELTIRLAAVKSLLIKKGVMTEEELEKEMELTSDSVMETFNKDPAIVSFRAIAEELGEEVEKEPAAPPKPKYDRTKN